MLGRLLDLIYGSVGFIADRLSERRGIELRARWALRCAAWAGGGHDDDFLAERFHLAKSSPHILDVLEKETAGKGWIKKKKRLAIHGIRDALDRGVTDPF
jgi:hypothetical protein